MTFVLVPREVRPQISSQKYARNGQVPTADLQRELIAQLEQVVTLRTREIFRWNGSTSPEGSSATAPRNRWRFAFRTSAMHARLRVVFVQALAANKSYTDPTARLSIYDSTGAVLQGTLDSHYGSIATFTSDAPSNFGTFSLTLSATAPSTIYTGLFQDVTQGNRLVACVVYEETLAPDTTNGYPWPGVVTGGPIGYLDRQALALMANARWSDGGTLLNLCSDLDTSAPGTTVVTPANMIDGSTSPSSGTAGVTLNLLGHATATQTGVPVTMMVYGQATTAAGTVQLRDSTGTVQLACSVGTTLGWYTVTGTLPALDSKKYDLYFFSGSATHLLTVYAVSLWEQG